jgi:hypothetical protein
MKTIPRLGQPNGNVRADLDRSRSEDAWKWPPNVVCLGSNHHRGRRHPGRIVNSVAGLGRGSGCRPCPSVPAARLFLRRRCTRLSIANRCTLLLRTLDGASDPQRNVRTRSIFGSIVHIVLFQVGGAASDAAGTGELGADLALSSREGAGVRARRLRCGIVVGRGLAEIGEDEMGVNTEAWSDIARFLDWIVIQEAIQDGLNGTGEIGQVIGNDRYSGWVGWDELVVRLVLGERDKREWFLCRGGMASVFAEGVEDEGHRGVVGYI